MEAYDNTFIAVRYYFNETIDAIHSAVSQGELVAIRVTYAEESGEK
jgi:hypothetical protein